MFITEDDYKSVCDDFEFEQICGLKPEDRKAAERSALEL